jgi:protein ECT2
MGDLFGGSINGHRRAKSTTTTSRSSTYTATTGTTDSLFKSSRSQSTARTSVDDSESVYSSRSSKRGKLRKEYSESDAGSLGRNFLSRSFRSSKSFARSRSRSTERSDEPSDREDDTVMTNVDSNDDDLTVQLEIAKKNSLNQDGNGIPIEIGVHDDSIYEGKFNFCVHRRSYLRRPHRRSPAASHSAYIESIRGWCKEVDNTTAWQRTHSVS